MKIDQQKLEKLTKMPDDELWREIVKIAKSHGIALNEKTPSHSELEKMRMAVLSGAKLNLGVAMKMINEYKKGK